jgi:replicative DNA helicase
MTIETPWETPETLFADDPDRAAGLEEIAAVMRGAAERPWLDTVDALADMVREERARRTACEPLAPASFLLRAVFADIHDRYTRRQETGQDAIGHGTGFPRLDRILGGLDRGRMSVLLAAPGAGKTTFSNQVAYTVAAAGAPVVYVSFENSPDDLVLKQVARIAGKNASEIRRGMVSPASLQAAYETFQRGAGQRLFYVTGTSATSIETLRAALDQVQRRHPELPPVLVVDFLQRLATTSMVVGRGSGLDDMRGRVGIIAQQLRELATETGAHIWAISSTNRAAYNTEKATPTLASARESGDVEFAADHVITLATGSSDGLSMTTDPYVLGVVKNRHGETGTVSISRERHTMRMVETEAKMTTFAEQVRASA